MKKGMLVAAVFLAFGPLAHGQGCAICSKTAAGLGKKSGEGLNHGILYLAALPLTIMGTLGAVWWKYNKSNEPTQQ